MVFSTPKYKFFFSFPRYILSRSQFFTLFCPLVSFFFSTPSLLLLFFLSVDVISYQISPTSIFFPFPNHAGYSILLFFLLSSTFSYLLKPPPLLFPPPPHNRFVKSPLTYEAGPLFHTCLIEKRIVSRKNPLKLTDALGTSPSYPVNSTLLFFS